MGWVKCVVVEPIERQELFHLKVSRDELIPANVLHHFVQSFCPDEK